MLAYYFYTTLVFVSWNVVRWIFDGQRGFANSQSGHSPGLTSRVSPSMPHLRVVAPDPGTSRWFDAMHSPRIGMHAQSRKITGVFPHVEAHVPPKGGAPADVHKNHDKIFKVVEGTFRFRCAGDVLDVTPGTTIIVARGVEHSWINPGPAPGRITFSFVPHGVENVSCAPATEPDN